MKTNEMDGNKSGKRDAICDMRDCVKSWDAVFSGFSVGDEVMLLYFCPAAIGINLS